MLGRKKQRGQAMAEYFVVGGVILIALSTPITLDGKTGIVINLLLDSMKQEYAGFLYAVGQPPLPKNP